MLATFVASTLLALTPVHAFGPPQSCSKTYTVKMAVRGIHSAYSGIRDVSAADRRHLRRFIRCQRNQGAKHYLHGVQKRSIARWYLRRNPPVPTGFDSPEVADVPGVPWDFAACVAFRESSSSGTDARTDTVYGIIPASGYYVLGAALSVQKHAFADLYAAHGVSPWEPYDGC